jgi:tetratricopeptide (TPR) repeat protein
MTTNRRGRKEVLIHTSVLEFAERVRNRTQELDRSLLLITELQTILAQADQEADERRRAELCHEALGLIAREQNVALWAALHAQLGSSLLEGPGQAGNVGEQAKVLDEAIEHFGQALKVYRSGSFPRDWARTQNNLGITYSNRIQGERADNLERAIAAYEAALTVYTREGFPQEWARTQNNVGIAYSNRIRGERADNLERAIAAYEAALTVYTHEAFPHDWAGTQNNLGNAYSDRIRGERADNLERAIAAFEAAVTVYTREASPQHWANTQNNLGNAYNDRVQGERADNLERRHHRL